MRPPGLFLLAQLALAWAAGPVAAQVSEYDLKAAVVYNFMQFTQWPETALKRGVINLCATADGPLFIAMQGIVGKTVHGRPIVLSALTNAAPGDCQVVVITVGDRARVAQIQKIIGNGPVLTIADDSERLRESQIIDMTLEGGRVAFGIDNSRAVESGLTISSRLLRLARSVR